MDYVWSVNFAGQAPFAFFKDRESAVQMAETCLENNEATEGWKRSDYPNSSFVDGVTDKGKAVCMFVYRRKVFGDVSE